jgi:hypothetical protein
VLDVMKIRGLKPQGPVQACSGTAFTSLHYMTVLQYFVLVRLHRNYILFAECVFYVENFMISSLHKSRGVQNIVSVTNKKN